MPQAESAFVSVRPSDGAILSLVGGFDFDRNKFNHVTQAYRQPGSSFKPFIYSAALEKGFSPATVVNDAPLYFDAAQTGGEPWEPKNYDGTFEGPMRLRTALMKSKNLVTVRVMQAIGPQYAQDYIARFGFDPKLHPAYLTMALGAGAATPLQMVAAYSVFANGGYRVTPYLIDRIVDARGNVLSKATPAVAGVNAEPAIDPRNAFIMTTMMRDVVRAGTARARQPARPARPRRQDGDDQRQRRRLVLRLQCVDGRGRLDRLRPAADARQQRDRRGCGVADLDDVHGQGAQGRARNAAQAAGRSRRRAHQCGFRLARNRRPRRHPRIFFLGIHAAQERRRTGHRRRARAARGPQSAVLSFGLAYRIVTGPAQPGADRAGDGAADRRARTVRLGGGEAQGLPRAGLERSGGAAGQRRDRAGVARLQQPLPAAGASRFAARPAQDRAGLDGAPRAVAAPAGRRRRCGLGDRPQRRATRTGGRGSQGGRTRVDQRRDRVHRRAAAGRHGGARLNAGRGAAAVRLDIVSPQQRRSRPRHNDEERLSTLRAQVVAGDGARGSDSP